MNEVSIRTEYIALGQFLKWSGCIDTGGQAKAFLLANRIRVNGEEERRRGKKLYPGDVVEIEGFGKFQVVRT